MQSYVGRLGGARRPPVAPPPLAGFDVAAAWYPLGEVSGDFYDWYATQTAAVTITVADVMGSDLSAAILAARLRKALRRQTKRAGLAEALSATQALHVELDATTTLVTVFHATVGADGRLCYIDAGHGLNVLVRDGRLDRLVVRGVPLGVAGDSVWPVGQDQLASGDSLVVFSDGLLDLYGGLEETLGAVFDAATAGRDAQSIADVLTSRAPVDQPRDDVTVVVARRL